MKRKVKKGVKLLNGLIEGTVTFDAKEAFNSSSPVVMNNILPPITQGLAEKESIEKN